MPVGSQRKCMYLSHRHHQFYYEKQIRYKHVNSCDAPFIYTDYQVFHNFFGIGAKSDLLQWLYGRCVSFFLFLWKIHYILCIYTVPKRRLFKFYKCTYIPLTYRQSPNTLYILLLNSLNMVTVFKFVGNSLSRPSSCLSPNYHCLYSYRLCIVLVYVKHALACWISCPKTI